MREYRKTHGVPMVELHAFIELLRQGFGVPYPLADRRPYIAGQLLLTPPSAAFVERVTWHADVAAGWRPDSNRDSPVRILPDVRFGRPSVKGISTEVIREQDEVGVDLEEIARTYQLDLADVRWALAYEYSQRAA